MPKEQVNGGMRLLPTARAERAAEAVDGLDGDLHRHVRVDEHELLAAEPGDHVVAAHVVAENPGEQLERLVADLVPEVVVEPLELVEVGEHHHERRRRLDELDHLGLERPAVGQAGQPVGRRLVPGALECAERTEPVAGERGEPDELLDDLGFRRSAVVARHVQHAELSSCHGDGHADC